MFSMKSMVGENNYKLMISWLSTACKALRENLSDILRFPVLTGLRPGGALHSIRLVQASKNDYLNKDG